MSKTDFYNFLWSFGNHEPISMYKRIGRRSTGGIEGGALWLEKWHNWYDSEECAKTISGLGVNILHCRFYKGMGWEFEKDDFPRVRKFVDCCRRHGIKVLAYVQYSTLYYEFMKHEIPDLDDWAAIDEHGAKIPYNFDPTFYYRWMPCVNNPDWLAYLKKMIAIGIQEGGFDGILLDNCHTASCHCSRCKAMFRDYLRSNCDASDFGLPSFDHVECPPEPTTQYEELKDPLLIAWQRFRIQSNCNALSSLYKFTKHLNPDIIVTGNTCNIRRICNFQMGLSPSVYHRCFDLITSQSGNEPCVRDGMVINRIREMMLAEALEMPIFPLADSDAGMATMMDEIYIAGLMEARVFGGIPADRIVMTPLQGGDINIELHTKRKKILFRFFDISTRYQQLFQAEVYAPVGVLYSIASQQLSADAASSLLSQEEVMLHNHIPFRLVIGNGKTIDGLDRCRILIAIAQSCLSDAELQKIRDFISCGGIVFVDNKTGDNDENNRQRAGNPFSELIDDESVILVDSLKSRIVDDNWQLLIKSPKNADNLLNSVNKRLEMPFYINAPDEVFCRIIKNKTQFIIHFVNYSGQECHNAEILCQCVPEYVAAATFSTPELKEQQSENNVTVPPFSSWAMIVIECSGKTAGMNRGNIPS